MLIWPAPPPFDIRRAQRLRFLANVLIVTGVLLLVSPAGWVAYTALAVAPAQTAALAAWNHRDGSSAAPVAARPSTTHFLLTIPRLGIRRVVPPGADLANLRKFGVGHIAWSALPGDPGVVGIAGHRTTYGAPFIRLNTLRPGDLIQLDFRGRRYTYTVSRSEVVTPDRVDVLDIPGSRGIALVTCTPAYSAAYRLVVLGTLASVTTAP